VFRSLDFLSSVVNVSIKQSGHFLKNSFWIKMHKKGNYLFQYGSESDHLQYIPEAQYQTENVKKWSNASQRIDNLLNIGQTCMYETAEEMGVSHSIKIIRKERALGKKRITIVQCI
jgi:hypothetical protein